MSVYTVSNLTWCVAYIRTDALTNSSSATLGLCTKPQLSPLWVILLKINRGNITRSLVSSLWIRNKNKIYYSCPENCLSLMFPLLFIGLCISCKSLHDRQSNLKVGQFSTGQAYSQTVSDKKNKSINPPHQTLFLYVSLSLCGQLSLYWSSVAWLIFAALLRWLMHWTVYNLSGRKPVNTRLEPFYGSGKQLFRIPLSAVPAASFTNMRVVGISKAWLGSSTTEFSFFF